MTEPGHIDHAAAALLAAASEVPVEAACAAEMQLSTAHQLVYAAGGQVGEQLAHDLAELLNEARELRGSLAAFRATLEAAAKKIGPAVLASATAPEAPPPIVWQPKTRTPDGQKITRERAQQLLADLPPTVPALNTGGAKTHGRWTDEHGNVHAIVSGEDEDSAEVWRILQDRGIPLRGRPVRVTDVEQKLAARMVRDGRRRLDVTINNLPCKGRWSCEELLPVILPEGYALTVHGPGYQRTFTGGMRPW